MDPGVRWKGEGLCKENSDRVAPCRDEAGDIMASSN